MPPPAEPGNESSLGRALEAPDTRSGDGPERTDPAAHVGRPALLAAARTDLSPEMRRRVDILLQATRGPDLSPDGLRSTRAVEVLERIGTANALALLRVWSAGPAGETLAEASRGAVQRMTGR